MIFNIFDITRKKERKERKGRRKRRKRNKEREDQACLKWTEWKERDCERIAKEKKIKSEAEMKLNPGPYTENVQDCWKKIVPDGWKDKKKKKSQGWKKER